MKNKKEILITIFNELLTCELIPQYIHHHYLLHQRHIIKYILNIPLKAGLSVDKIISKINPGGRLPFNFNYEFNFPIPLIAQKIKTCASLNTPSKSVLHKI